MRSVTSSACRLAAACKGRGANQHLSRSARAARPASLAVSARGLLCEGIAFLLPSTAPARRRAQ